MWPSDRLAEFDKWMKSRPETTSHGISSDDIQAHMKQLKPHTWRLEGNILKGMTDMGMLSQVIPTDYILVATDEQGLPVFEKVVLSK